MTNIIYILPYEKKPTGGINVVLQHSELINKINNKFKSQIIFIKKKKTSKWKQSFNKFINSKSLLKERGWKFNEVSILKKKKHNWCDAQIDIKDNFKLDKKNDFVILPEIFAHFAKEFLIKNKIKYAVFVQNGHAIDYTSDYIALKNAYKNSSIILTVSSHIDNCVREAFPDFKKKIFKINQYINVGRCDYKSKLNIITYMPRKLKDHSNLVLFFLKNKLPNNWKVVALDRLNKKEIFKHLKKSKIFLSFSNLEGFGLPPIEAALLGNRVIGYTGEGGKEYWKPPIFEKVEQGNILEFVKKIKLNLNNKIDFKSSSAQRIHLTKKYSYEGQHKNIISLLKKIKKALHK
ncbi:hypothetical protein OAO77_00345 [Candidatus Pelagibacter sp.]|nr:hypothetical protein [Candidatus Pelagibacter sp.]